MYTNLQVTAGEDLVELVPWPVMTVSNINHEHESVFTMDGEQGRKKEGHAASIDRMIKQS